MAQFPARHFSAGKPVDPNPYMMPQAGAPPGMHAPMPPIPPRVKTPASSGPVKP